MFLSLLKAIVCPPIPDPPPPDGFVKVVSNTGIVRGMECKGGDGDFEVVPGTCQGLQIRTDLEGDTARFEIKVDQLAGSPPTRRMAVSAKFTAKPEQPKVKTVS